MELLDTFGRPLRDLRISVTDRCNFRCVYCMPKEVYGRDHAFLERRELLTFEEIAARRAGVRRPRRAEDPDHGWRAARAPRPRAADRAAVRARRGSDPDHERVAAAAEGTAARRCRAPQDHGQPGLARRRAVSRAERRRFSRRSRARRHRCGDRRRSAGEGERGDQARRERRSDRPDGEVLPRTRPHAAVHRVHGRRPHERLAPRRRRARQRRSSTCSTALSASSRSTRGTAARSRNGGATRTGQARWASSPPSHSPSAATAHGPASRPKGSSSPACSRSGGTTCGR